MQSTHERPRTSFRFACAHRQHRNTSTFVTPDINLQTSLPLVGPTTDRDPSSISIGNHLRKELHPTSSRYPSKQCPYFIETIYYFPVYEIGDALTSWDMAYRDPCRKLAYSAKVGIQGHMGCGQTSTLVSVGFATSAPATGVQRPPWCHTAPRDFPQARVQWREQL